MFLVFFVFTSRSTFLIVESEVSVFLFIVIIFTLTQLKEYHQHRPEVEVFQPVSVLPGFLGPSQWCILKQSWKAGMT
jgi:hypothetical protein